MEGRCGRRLALGAAIAVSLGVAAGLGSPAGLADRRAPAPEVVRPESVWASPEACHAALARGRTRRRAPGTAAVATWNIRWFPDGVPFGSRERPQPTNIDWLACALAWLSVDVVALQEIQTHPAAIDEMANVVARLGRHTHSRWRLALDDCEGPSFQHVGLLWNTRRVSTRTLRVIGALNPRGGPCAGRLRPGFGGRLRFAGGLDVHLVSVHLKSGPEPASQALRAQSLAAVGAAYAQLQRMEPEQDVVLAGDFNTQGCPRCAPPVEPSGEIASLDLAPVAGVPEFRRVQASASCTHYARGRPASLDHFLVAGGMRELGGTARASVEGVCAERDCEALPRRSSARALRELSDHCPVVLELLDRDRD